MKTLLRILVGMSCLGSSAIADGPVYVQCVTPCGGTGPRPYAYDVGFWVNPVQGIITEFTVGTNDLDPTHYSNVLAPTGWEFTVEHVGMPQDCSICTSYGTPSQGFDASGTKGWVRWWAVDPNSAVTQFTFGFHHDSDPEDVGWQVCVEEPSGVGW